MSTRTFYVTRVTNGTEPRASAESMVIGVLIINVFNWIHLIIPFFREFDSFYVTARVIFLLDHQRYHFQNLNKTKFIFYIKLHILTILTLQITTIICHYIKKNIILKKYEKIISKFILKKRYISNLYLIIKNFKKRIDKNLLYH